MAFPPLMTHSFALREFGFEESDFVDFVISCRHPKALPTSASREHRVAFHDPLLARVCDIGINESRSSSLRYIHDNIETPIGSRNMRCEYYILVDSYTYSFTTRCDELDRDRFDIASLPVGECDRVEFEHVIFLVIYR